MCWKRLIMSFGMQSMDYVSTNILGKFVGGKYFEDNYFSL